MRARIIEIEMGTETRSFVVVGSGVKTALDAWILLRGPDLVRPKGEVSERVVEALKLGDATIVEVEHPVLGEPKRLSTHRP